eukprot:Platyproteum_vivax@DN4093_c0_g1_i1.p1
MSKHVQYDCDAIQTCDVSENVVEGQVRRKSFSRKMKRLLTSDNMPLDITYLPEFTFPTGRLGFCMAPGRKKEKTGHVWLRDINKDMIRLKRGGCQLLVTLLTELELGPIHVTAIADAATRAGIEHVHFPIRDKWVPADSSAYNALIMRIISCLDQGKNCVVHCNGGKGRSALTLSCVLLHYNYNVNQSIKIIQSNKKGSLKNPTQKVYACLYRHRFVMSNQRVRDAEPIKMTGPETHTNRHEDETIDELVAPQTAV